MSRADVFCTTKPPMSVNWLDYIDKPNKQEVKQTRAASPANAMEAEYAEIASSNFLSLYSRLARTDAFQNRTEGSDNSLATLVELFAPAIAEQVLPSSSQMAGSAPCSNKHLTADAWLPAAARCRGVRPSESLSFTSRMNFAASTHSDGLSLRSR
jgi:hypothetical protein